VQDWSTVRITNSRCQYSTAKSQQHSKKEVRKIKLTLSRRNPIKNEILCVQVTNCAVAVFFI
jgi:hypothetical protein